MNLLPKIVSGTQRAEQRREQLYRALLRNEAKLGGQLFGPIPAGHRREFFNLDKHTWVWHEEWIDAAGRRQVSTTRYTIRPDGVLKSQGSNSYQRLSESELRNLYRAAKLYRQRIGASYQQMLHVG